MTEAKAGRSPNFRQAYPDHPLTPDAHAGRWGANGPIDSKIYSRSIGLHPAALCGSDRNDRSCLA